MSYEVIGCDESYAGHKDLCYGRDSEIWPTSFSWTVQPMLSVKEETGPGVPDEDVDWLGAYRFKSSDLDDPDVTVR
jgi:hypothetical protein